MNDLNIAISELGQGFDSFKEKFGERLDNLELEMGRQLPLGDGKELSAKLREEQNAAFYHYVRTGDRSQLAADEVKDLSIGGTNAGGVTVPDYLSRNIQTRLLDISPMSALVTGERASSGDINIPVNVRGTGTAWSSETGARSSQATPTIRTVQPTHGGLYSVVAATQWIMADSFLNLESFLINEIAAESAVALESAIVDGDGTNKPTGFLQAPVVVTDDATRTFGELQYVASGNASSIPHDPVTPVHGGDVLLDVVDALRVPYRSGARWVMNRATRTVIAKWKDADERHILTPGMGGQPDTLFGYPVVISEAMPDIAANALPIAFGDLKAAYRLLPIGTPFLVVDPYTTKGMVEIWYEQRYAGQLIDDDALKLLQISLT